MKLNIRTFNMITYNKVNICVHEKKNYNTFSGVDTSSGKYYLHIEGGGAIGSHVSISGSVHDNA